MSSLNIPAILNFIKIIGKPNRSLPTLVLQATRKFLGRETRRAAQDRSEVNTRCLYPRKQKQTPPDESDGAAVAHHSARFMCVELRL
jgi:hypothetical protein